MNAISITDRDIDVIETLMEVTFDDERRHVLRALHSINVQACPGSGKTTTLVGKLGILAQKLPPDQGICVLSHTNVAGNEIRQRLKERAGILWSYPHFIGTIQSFVDTYLAIPAMLEKYGIRPWIIDDEAFADAVSRQSAYLAQPVRSWLDQNPRSELRDIRFRFADLGLCWIKNGSEDTPLKNPNTRTYTALLRMKEQIAKTGCIAFHDAFALANQYLDAHPDLAKVISTRFTHVFVDEAQDTDSFQWELIRKIFNEDVVIQCFGDTNQAIFNITSSSGDSEWQVTDGQYALSRSHRLSDSVAVLVKNVCDYPQEIVGNSSNLQHKHSIFVFEDPTQVLPAFSELIESENLVAGTFKCVGLRKERNDDRLSISSYHPTFKKASQTSNDQSSLKAYFSLAREATEQGKAGEAQRWLLKSLVKLSRLQGIKDENGRSLSSTSFMRQLMLIPGALEQFQANTLSWIDSYARGQQLRRDDVVSAFHALFSIIDGKQDWQWTNSATQFINNDSLPIHQISSSNNYFDAGQIRVEIDTIHGVKGETHTATLLLETFNRTNHLKSILPYLKGNRPSRVNASMLRLAYVAMTRPTHLLCLAMPNSELAEKDKGALAAMGWHIQNLG